MTKQEWSIFILILGPFLPLSYVSAGTVLSSYKYAWSNNAGYINFENVTVSDNQLSGFAWSANYGWINFNPAQGGVINDGTGNLSGSAWGEKFGWIDFNNVSIDGSGKFFGTATGTLVGTITFDCPIYCDVATDWRSVSSQSSDSVGDGDQGPDPAQTTTTTANVNTIANNPAQSQNTLIPAANPSNTQAVDTSPAVSTPVAGNAEQPALSDISAELTQSGDQRDPRITIIGGALLLGVGLGLSFLAMRGKWHARNI